MTNKLMARRLIQPGALFLIGDGVMGLLSRAGILFSGASAAARAGRD